VPRAHLPDQPFNECPTDDNVAKDNDGLTPQCLCNVHTAARSLALGYDAAVASSETLRSVIDAGRTSKRLDELSTARVIGKIAEQLHAAQQKAGAGKAIGPITPAGISIDASGAAKLGLAEPAAVTYSSPEQITDDTGDRRSDVFSLGAVMWEALTHEPLFADAGEVKTKTIASPSELNANIPAELGAICMKALARTPSDRYQSAKVMAAEIEAVLEQASYADNDEHIAEYMAELGKPANLPKVTLITPPHGVAPAPAPAPVDAPRPITTTKPPKLNDTLPSLGAPLPPILPAKRSPTEPPPVIDTKTDAPIDVLVAKPIEAKAAVLDDAKTVPFEREPAPEQEQPPKPELPKAQSSSTVLGFAPLAPAPIEPSILAAPSAAQSDPILLATPKQPIDPEPLRPKPSSSSAPPIAAEQVPAPAPKRDATPAPKDASKAAAVVALPKNRDSTDELGGWGWGTDSHDAIAEPEYDDAPEPSSRKTLLYVIGGGVALAAIVTVIAVGFGGGSSASTKKPATQPSAAVQEGGAAIASDNIATGSDIVVVATGTPEAATGSAGSAAGSDVVAAAVTPDATVAEVVVAVDAAVAVAPPPPAPDAAVVAVAPPPPPPPPVVVKHDEPKPKEHHADPPRVAHADPKPQDPYKATSKPKGDAQTTYKQGLQAYLRGDTSSALTQLKASLDADPNYAPTWRGLGLVYEKLNDKDKARAAYHRYLQLAPNAGDADNIRNRLERLF
jgi:Tetratricopeptide repeat